MAIDPTRVPRFGHGSRVPGWDRAADLTKDPEEVPDPATTPVPEELRTVIESYMARYPDHRSATIPALHAMQDMYGWCTPQGMEQVACVMRLTPAYLNSVASFYDMFFLEPVGTHVIDVCTNLACALRGAGEVLEAFEGELGVSVGGTTDDGTITLRKAECLGGCSWAPVVAVDERYRERVSPGDVAEIVNETRSAPAVRHA